MVTVKVVHRDSGRPAEGRKVAISFDAIGRGLTSGERTDSNGEADFNVDPGDGKVFVDGNKKFEGRISGRIVVYI